MEDQSVGKRFQLLELEDRIIHNLHALQAMLQDAVSSGFVSGDHGKSIFKSYLKVSGLDIPKNINEKKGK